MTTTHATMPDMRSRQPQIGESILIAEDDDAIAGPLARSLERAGAHVTVCTDGPTALRIASSGTVDLVILDLGLPGMDGLDVCRQLRQQHNQVRVLILTARCDEIDFVIGLDNGADDYVGKPFRLAELLARVRALLRRDTLGGIEVSGIRMDVTSRRVWQSDREIHLSHKEFELLRVLLEHAGEVMTRAALMSRVWSDHRGHASKTLDMHISWLRKKLGDSQPEHRLITTVRSVGFRFETDG